VLVATGANVSKSVLSLTVQFPKCIVVWGEEEDVIGGPVAASYFFGRGGREEGKIVESQHAWVFVDEMAFLVQRNCLFGETIITVVIF
jgi:hypothetical protein